MQRICPHAKYVYVHVYSPLYCIMIPVVPVLLLCYIMWCVMSCRICGGSFNAFMSCGVTAALLAEFIGGRLGSPPDWDLSSQICRCDAHIYIHIYINAYSYIFHSSVISSHLIHVISCDLIIIE